MNKHHFQIHINAPKEKVWEVMLGRETYRKWADIFMPGSDFDGSWDKGSKILFFAPDENGRKMGMAARILENRPYEFVSIEHLGTVTDGVEDTESDEAKEWAGAREEYTLRAVADGTDVDVDVDLAGEYEDEMVDVWPKALERLKSLVEADV